MEEKILQRATDLFVKLGYKSVTMDDIAADLSISKKTVYKYFKTKVDLVMASVNHLHITCEDVICGVRNENLGAVEENFAIHDKFNEIFADIKLSPIYQLKRFYPEVYESFYEKNMDCHDEHFTENLKKGIDQGDFRSNIDIDFVTKVYFRLLFWIHTTPDMQQLERDEIQLLDYHHRAIVTPQGLAKLEKQLSKYE